jgi:hypothetical protein
MYFTSAGSEVFYVPPTDAPGEGTNARFCSEECQRHFNAESRKLKSAGVFGSAAT